MCELYPGEFEAMEHNGRMDAIEPSDMLSAEEIDSLLQALSEGEVDNDLWNEIPKSANTPKTILKAFIEGAVSNKDEREKVIAFINEVL